MLFSFAPSRRCQARAVRRPRGDARRLRDAPRIRPRRLPARQLRPPPQRRRRRSEHRRRHHRRPDDHRGRPGAGHERASTSSMRSLRPSSAAPPPSWRCSRSSCWSPRRWRMASTRMPAFEQRLAFLRERALHGEVIDKDVAGTITDADVRARYDKQISETPPSQRGPGPPHPGQDQGRGARQSSRSSTAAPTSRSSPTRRRSIRAARPAAAISAISRPARWCRNSRRPPCRSTSAPTPRSR